MFDVEIISKMRKLFEPSNCYEDCFDFKNAKILFKHENKNYIINLILDAKPPYKLLYILFKIELDILKNYLLKSLTLNRIREFTSRANALMLFVFKKNNNFRFCVDYKELNAFIIKNKYLFSLINENVKSFYKRLRTLSNSILKMHITELKYARTMSE